MRTNIYLIIVLSTICFSSCYREKDLKYSLNAAGKNRIELEKVLEHYKDSGPKYDAACFLIKNMPGYYSYAKSSGLDSLRKIQSVIFHKKHFPRDLQDKWSKFSYKSTPKVYDCHAIKAEYLIENIDLAFAAWQKRPWRHSLSFDEFCEWILPYRIGDEPLENWRKFFLEKYSAVLDSLYKGNDMMVAADSLIRFVKRESGYVYSDELSLPHLGALFLQKNCVGYCRESCDLSVYVLRSVGIPVATDFIISAPEAQGGHSWNVIKDGTGIIPFEYDEGKVTQGYDDKRLKGKIYRQCFGKQKKDITGIMDKPEVPAVLKSPYIKDVTGEYFGENSVEVEIDETECGQYAYLGVFSFPGWKAIDMALHQNGKASMKNIEPDVIYVPLASNHNGSLFHTIGFPFWLTDKGLKYFQPEKEVETVELFRKYPLRKWTRFHISEIIGSHLDVSNSLDFRQSELLYMVADTPRVNYNQVICHPQKKYRYVRYQAAADKPARIAELMLFRSEEDTVNLPFKIINGSEPCKGNEKEVKENICDGNYLTYFLSDEKGGYVTLDLGKDEWIKKIVYVPRNDENFISMGHEYELFYQNGPDGWVSLGRKTATEPRLVYNNVPKNALLWLHNLSAGKEEQVFYMQNGQQIFLNKW